MRLSALALDYGGTITRDGALDAIVRQAIATVREAGITVLLVTGRTLDDLRGLAGDLHFVDGVIAENGAMVHLPQGGHTSVLAPPVPPAFLEELQTGKRTVLVQLPARSRVRRGVAHDEATAVPSSHH